MQATNEKEKVVQIIDEKLKQLQEADTKNRLSGKLNFAVHLNVYSHSPYLPAVLKKKKKLIRLMWIESFLISIFMVLIYSDITEKYGDNIFKAIAGLLILSLLPGLLLVYIPIRTIATETNAVQVEIKKMILEDVKQQVEALP